jgi:hypothetical protein
MIEAEKIEPRDLTQQELVGIHVNAELNKREGLGIGLCGAHRTGKTSLCVRLAEKNSFLPFVRTSAKEAAVEFGFDVDNPGTFEERMDWQEYLLAHFATIYEDQNSYFVTDRTPLDMAAYLLADAPVGQLDPALDKRVANYLERCQELTELHFKHLILVQPGIQHVVVEGSPAPNRAYQEKLNALMLGLGFDYKRPLTQLPRSLTNFDDRAATIAKIIAGTVAGYKVLLSHLPRQ